MSGLAGRGGLVPVACLLWGGGGIPAFTEADTLPPNPCGVESQTPVKTLPWPNFVAAGKYDFPGDVR